MRRRGGGLFYIIYKKNQKNDIEIKDEKLIKFCKLKRVKLKMKRNKRTPNLIWKGVLIKVADFCLIFIRC